MNSLGRGPDLSDRSQICDTSQPCEIFSRYGHREDWATSLQAPPPPSYDLAEPGGISWVQRPPSPPPLLSNKDGECDTLTQSSVSAVDSQENIELGIGKCVTDLYGKSGFGLGILGLGNQAGRRPAQLLLVTSYAMNPWVASEGIDPRTLPGQRNILCRCCSSTHYQPHLVLPLATSIFRTASSRQSGLCRFWMQMQGGRGTIVVPTQMQS
jgi:hypothetical protein